MLVYSSLCSNNTEFGIVNDPDNYNNVKLYYEFAYVGVGFVNDKNTSTGTPIINY